MRGEGGGEGGTDTHQRSHPGRRSARTVTELVERYVILVLQEQRPRAEVAVAVTGAVRAV